MCGLLMSKQIVHWTFQQENMNTMILGRDFLMFLSNASTNNEWSIDTERQREPWNTAPGRTFTYSVAYLQRKHTDLIVF